MGNNQYGLQQQHIMPYSNRSLTTFTVLRRQGSAAGRHRKVAPPLRAQCEGNRAGLRRRDTNAGATVRNGSISRDKSKEAERRPIPEVARPEDKVLQTAAVAENVFEELRGCVGLTSEDLRHGRIQVYSTVDARVQQIVNEALEHGLELYEKRHPSARGLTQGSVVVLRNRDAGILAETGGRQFYEGRSTSYSDFNRVTKSLRQAGSAMKPIVYLAAFRQGTFDLDTMVPDQPISVPDGGKQTTKWISNYDDRFKGMIPLRKALAESRNAVAIWITEQIGIDSVLQMSRNLGVHTPLQPYAATALGASEVKLLELANAYRTMASGILARAVRDTEDRPRFGRSGG